VKTILLLDDERPIRKYLYAVLAPLGYELLEAATAEEAFHQFEQKDCHLDLLIADVNLPLGPSGVRVALGMRSLLPFLRVILTSGYPQSLWDDQDAAELSELPSDSVICLQKPFAASALLESVHRLAGLPLRESPALQKV